MRAEFYGWLTVEESTLSCLVNILKVNLIRECLTGNVVIANNQLVCNPKLMLFDLKRNGTLILRYDFPEEVVARGTN